MKKLFTFAVSALMASAVWAGVITLDMNKPINPATIEYGANNVWTECYNDEDYTWLEFGAESGEFMLSHLIAGEGSSWGGYYWDGFCPAIGGDQTDYGQAGSSAGWTVNYGGCMAGGGCVINADGTVTADPAQPYLVAYCADFWGFPTNEVMYIDEEGNDEFEPVGVYVSNHPWPYYGCVHGDGFGTGFAEGDYFEIIAHGVAADGSETTVSMNLIEFTDGELIAANDWTFFDLSSLGKVTKVYFTLNSTDVGDYGMNTAAYFCMDKFQVKGADDPEPPVVDQVGAPTFEGYTVDGIHGYGVHIYPTTEGSTIMYRVFIEEDNEWVLVTDWTEYMGVDMEIWKTEANAKFRVEAYAYIGQVQSQQVAYEFVVLPYTGIDEMNAGKAVAGVRYFNVAGQEMTEANGLTIVVTTYTDGTTSTMKVVK